MAKHRFAPCAVGNSWEFKSPDFSCSKRVDADTKTIHARKQWLDGNPQI